MARPPSTRPGQSGYSLIELLVVLVIVGVLVLVGLSMLRRPKLTAVRTVMDQVEGAIMQAQKTAQATGQDVVVAVNGTWTATGTPDLTAATSPFILDPRRFLTPTSIPPPDPYTGVRVGANSETLASLYTRGGRDHMDAGVATNATGNGLANSLAGVPPFNSATDTSFATALGNQLCNGGQNSVTVNGVTYRFTSGFSIVVVALASGAPDPSGPVGVLVVPKNSANVFRFYKGAGVSTWIRI